MSGVLLDTNALIWLLADDARLGVTARQRLDDADLVCFSAASALEVTIKQMLGRLTLPGELLEAARAAHVVELALTATHARAISEFPTLVAHDPVDRMLLAQASVEGLALLTSDQSMLGLGLDWVIDARL